MQTNQSPLLKKYNELTHYFSSKKDGNIAFHVGDDPQNVLHNHQTLAKKLSYDYQTLVHMKQIHSSDVHVVHENDNFHNPRKCDALITDIPNKPLMVMVADCSPILLYDPVQQVIAVVHAGRQGAFKNIIKETIAKMEASFSSNTSNVLVSIGPSILACCYEVGEEIVLEAKELSLEYAIKKTDKKYYLDISRILSQQLKQANIPDENIEISQICSACNTDHFFSYRAEGQTGRFAGLICLS